MKQLTKEEAILLNSKDLTSKFSLTDLSIIQLFQDRLFIDINDFKKGLSSVFNRNIHTHDLSHDLRDEYKNKYPENKLSELEAGIFGVL